MKIATLKKNIALVAVGMCLMTSSLVEGKEANWYGLPLGSGAAIGAAIDINNVDVADGVMPTAHVRRAPLKRYYSKSAAKKVATMVKNSGDSVPRAWNELAYSTCNLTLTYYPEYNTASYSYDAGPYFKTDGTVIDGSNSMEASSGYTSKEVNPVAAAAFEKLFNKTLTTDYSLVTNLSQKDKAAGWKMIKQDTAKGIAILQDGTVGEYGPVRVREYFTKDTIKKLMANTCLESNYYSYEDMNNRNKYAYCEYVLKFARQKDVPGEVAADNNTFMWMELGNRGNKRCFYDVNQRPVTVGKTENFENPTLVDTWFNFEPYGQDQNYEFIDCYKDRLTVWAHCQERQD